MPGRTGSQIGGAPVGMHPILPVMTQIPDAGFTIASYNIRKAIGRDGRRDPARVLGVIAALGADIVVLQEADFRFQGRRAVFEPQDIMDLTGLVAIDVAPDAPGLGWHGNMLLVAPGVVVRDVTPLDLAGFDPRGAVVANLAVGDRRLRLIHAHLGLIPAQRRRQAAMLAGRVCTAGPTVLAGDLNAFRSGFSLRPLDAAMALLPTGPSFPTRRPVIRFDRMYHSAGLEAVSSGVVDSAAARLASDHLPIRARLRFED